MDIIDKKTNSELLRSTLAELAKAKSELQCARNDLDKMNSRLGFAIAVVNKMIDRNIEEIGR
jgi:hypothetical protein